MAKTGRPTTYSQETADAICEELATTDFSLQRICDQESMQAPSTVYLWLNLHPDFSEQYARAREAGRLHGCPNS